MTPSAAKSFTALLEPDGTALRWVIARVPFDIATVWPERRGRRVRGTIEGFAFRTSLFPDPRGSGTVLLVNKSMQAGGGVRLGDKGALHAGAGSGGALRGSALGTGQNPSRRSQTGALVWPAEPLHAAGDRQMG